MESKSSPTNTANTSKAPATTSDAPKAPSQSNTPNVIKFLIGGTAGYINKNF